MKFSLIVCTLGRYEELDQLFESLRKQTYSDFEVILVDQNDKDYLNEIINEYSNEFDIRHIFSEKGLSRARNIGLKYVSGQIVAFPDDDCWYPIDLLERVNNFFQDNKNPRNLVISKKHLKHELSLCDFTIFRGSASIFEAVLNESIPIYLTNKDADKNYVMLRNIFYKPLIENFTAFIINLKTKKILDSVTLRTNYTNIIELEKNFVNEDCYLFTKNYIGIPIFLSSKNNHISL